MSEEKEIKEKKQYMVDVYINPACIDPDGGPCPHDHKEEVKHYNPV